MNKNILMYTYNDTVLESPSPSTSETETTATSCTIHLFHSDLKSDQRDLKLPTDSLLPSLKQPHIEQQPEVSVVNIEVADLARRSSLTEHEKYNFFCNHFTSDIDDKFPVKVVLAFYIGT